MGFWLSTRQELETWSYIEMKRRFEMTSKGREHFEDFYEKYVTGLSLAPVVVFNGINYLVDRYTPLM